MNCPKCGNQNEDEAIFCASCGTQLTSSPETPYQNAEAIDPQQGGYQLPRINNYMAWSIVTTVCCCLPAGIVALIYSSKVDRLLMQGNYEGATNAARIAKIWNIVGLSILFILILITFILAIAMPTYAPYLDYYRYIG